MQPARFLHGMDQPLVRGMVKEPAPAARRWIGVGEALGELGKMSGRFSLFFGLLLAAFASPTAFAASPETCETPRVAVYFLHGEDSPTEGANAILSMAGEAAAQCETAVVGVVARFDPSAEGDLALALKRLASVAERLTGTGVPLDRIRLAAQPADEDNPAQGPGRIDIRVATPGEDASGAQTRKQARTPATSA
jgi:hypothetical protein